MKGFRTTVRWCVRLSVLLLCVVLFSPLAHAQAAVFVAQQGLLSIDAEHATALHDHAGTHWSVRASDDAGSNVLEAMPPDGYYRPGEAATAEYAAAFDTSATAYVWVRARASDSQHNSVYVGLDGQFIGVHVTATGDWTWNQYAVDDAGRATLPIAAGDHTLMLGIREGGVQIDRFVLTTDAAYEPTGTGPAESPRRGAEPAEPVPLPPVPTRTPRPTPSLPAPAPAPTEHPMGCKPNELFLDSQDWWVNPDGGNGQNFGHLHTQLCFPWKQTLRGTIQLTVHSVLHESPGTFRQLQVQTYQVDSANIVAFNRTFDRTLNTCQQTGGDVRDDSMTCVWTDTIDVDTRRARYDGEVQFRVRGFVREPDGKEMRTSTSLHAYLANGRPQYDRLYERLDDLEGRGWYTDLNYVRAHLRDATELLQPVRGVWQPHVIMGHGFEGTQGDSWFAGIDTDFHHNNPGLPACPHGMQGYRGHPVCGQGEFDGTLRIDTTQLSNGWHRLFLKADQHAPNGSIHSGVLATWFLVQNS